MAVPKKTYSHAHADAAQKSETKITRKKNRSQNPEKLHICSNLQPLQLGKVKLIFQKKSLTNPYFPSIRGIPE